MYKRQIIGISTGAGLGAVVALYFGFASFSAFAVPALAIASSMVAALVLVWLAGKDASVLSLVLAGPVAYWTLVWFRW